MRDGVRGSRSSGGSRGRGIGVDLEETLAQILVDGGVSPKKVMSIVEKILQVVDGWASRDTRKQYVSQLWRDLACVQKEKRLAVLINVLKVCGLPALTEEEQAQLSGFRGNALFHLRTVGQTIVRDLSNSSTRPATLIVLVMLGIFLFGTFSGTFSQLARSLFAIGRSANAVSQAAMTAPPAGNASFEEMPTLPVNNKPTPTPNPTPTPVPKPIPKALLPKGASGGYMGVSPMPDGERKLLSEGLSTLAGFAFGDTAVKGVGPLWRSVVNRNEENRLSPNSSVLSEYEERMAFYKCQCATPLTPECRKTTNIPAESGSWYDWFVTLAPLYNLTEEESGYVTGAMILCELVNQVSDLWPIPANSAEYGRWIMERRDPETQRFWADVLISAPELSQFRELWEFSGLNPETDDPFGEIIASIASGGELTPLPETKVKDVEVPELESAPVEKEPTSEPTESVQKPVEELSEGGHIGSVIEAMRAKVQRGVFRVGVNSNSSGGMFLGTGFYVVKAGKTYIVTNYHVVSSGCPCFIVDRNGGKRELNPLTSEGSSLLDMAVFEPKGWDIPADAYIFKLGDDPVEGQLVWSTGYPGGSADSFVFNSGDVVAVDTLLGKGAVEGVIVTNAQGDYGSSGAPLLDENLNVVGIYSGAASSDSGKTWEGKGYAFPVSRIDALLSTVLTK